jgi:hypothetical protein
MKIDHDAGVVLSPPFLESTMIGDAGRNAAM